MTYNAPSLPSACRSYPTLLMDCLPESLHPQHRLYFHTEGLQHTASQALSWSSMPRICTIVIHNMMQQYASQCDGSLAHMSRHVFEASTTLYTTLHTILRTALHPILHTVFIPCPCAKLPRTHSSYTRLPLQLMHRVQKHLHIEPPIHLPPQSSYAPEPPRSLDSVLRFAHLCTQPVSQQGFGCGSSYCYVSSYKQSGAGLGRGVHPVTSRAGRSVLEIGSLQYRDRVTPV